MIFAGYCSGNAVGPREQSSRLAWDVCARSVRCLRASRSSSLPPRLADYHCSTTEFVLSTEAPVYRTAAKAMVASYGLKRLSFTFARLTSPISCSLKIILVVAHVLLGIYMWRSNVRRDKKYGPADPVAAADAGMRGETESQSKNFRYVL